MFRNEMFPPGTGQHQEQTQKCETRDWRLVTYQPAYNKTARRRRRGTKGGEKTYKINHRNRLNT